MRKPEEIQRQIDGLEAMKSWLPEYSAFGENNWEVIDDQVSILKGESDSDTLIDDYEADEKDSCPLWDVTYWMEEVENDDLFETRD